MSFALRAHQRAAVLSIWGQLRRGLSTLRVAATGSGKTAEQAAIARIHLHHGGKRVLYVAPREELLDQAERWFLRVLPGYRVGMEIGREQGSRISHDGNRVILATPQTLGGKRLREIPEVDLLLVDEAHTFYDWLTGELLREPPLSLLPRVGWTATPDRLDAQRLIPKVFESCPSDQIYELGHAVEDGWVVPYRSRRVVVEELAVGEQCVPVDLDGEPKSPAALAAAARVLVSATENRQTVIFAVDMEHAWALAGALNELEPNVAAVVVGEMAPAERGQVYRYFEQGRCRFLVSVVLLTYGWDCPPVSCVAWVRPTGSRALYSQGCGRGSRLLGATLQESIAAGKPDCLVLDLVGNTSEHTLVTPQEALHPVYEEIRGLGRQKAPDATEDDEAPPEEELEAALEEEFAELPEGEAHLAYAVEDVDGQLEPLGISAGKRLPGDAPATRDQLRRLRELGLDDDGLDELSDGQAETLLEALLSRQAEGWCSVRQAWYLARRGLNPMQKREAAAEAIDAIMGNRHRVPPWLLEKMPGLLFVGKRALRLR